MCLTASLFAPILAIIIMDGVTGSKGGAGVWQRIISEMPPHELYVEAFGGAAVICRRMRPSDRSIIIERDEARCSSLIALWTPHGIGDHTVICADAISLLPVLHLDTATLVYCDPPYPLQSRRRQRRQYRYELTDDDHQRLCRCLRSLKCFVMVSTYANPIYAATLGDWRVVTIPTVTRGGSRSTELLYCNFPETDRRHDTRFVGHNYRERERIRRRVSRWVKMLQSMTCSERAAALAAIDAARGPHCP